MYEIMFSKEALRTLRRMPRNITTLIREKLEQLKVAPYAPNNNVTKLVGRSGYRLWIGDWRVIYELEDEKLVLLVIRIGPRGEVYE
jgi:mRNA interferase RelE/StbE